MKKICRFSYTVLVLLFCASVLSAQNRNGSEVLTLELEPYFSEPGNPESEAGKIIYKRIVQDDRDTAYFRVRSIEKNSHVFVEMSTEDAKQKLQFELSYPDKDEVITAGILDSRSSWKYQFAADEDFVIRAIPELIPSAYYILVWAGGEAQLDLSKTYETDTRGLGDLETVPIDTEMNVVWVIVFTVFLALILAFLFFKGRRKSKE